MPGSYACMRATSDLQQKFELHTSANDHLVTFLKLLETPSFCGLCRSFYVCKAAIIRAMFTIHVVMTSAVQAASTAFAESLAITNKSFAKHNSFWGEGGITYQLPL